MKTTIQKRLKNEKGLTLVELLAVIVILGIIAAIAVPSIGKIIENTKYNAVKADAINALNAANLYFAENIVDEADKEVTKVKVSDLKKDGYLESVGKLKGDAEIDQTGDALTIDGKSEMFSGTKVVTFKKATLTDINKDTQKGSQKDALTDIGTTP